MDPTNLFDSQFTVTAIDPDGKKFDRVSRIVAKSSSLDMNLSLDVAVDIYPISPNQNLTLQLASSLHKNSKTNKDSISMNLDDDNVDGSEEVNNSEHDSWRFDRQGMAGVADEFDYVMFGKIYKYDEGHSDIVTVYASFGGLLMALTGSYRHLSGITVGTNVYLLIR